MVFYQRDNVFKCNLINTTRSTIATTTIRESLNLAAYNFAKPNCSKFVIANSGGQYDLKSIRVSSYVPQRPDILTIGDSKTAGENGRSHYMSWPTLLNSLGVIVNISGSSDFLS